MRRKNRLNIKVGDKLQKARKIAGYTQEEVAEKIDCSNRYIGQLETNQTLGSIDVIIELCNLYNITLNELYSEYLTFNLDEIKEKYPNIVGYHQLNHEHRSIIDNTIEFLKSLENK